MSRDSSATYIHMHSSRLADLFEEFCHPPSTSNSTANASNPGSGANPNSSSADSHSGHIHIPGHFLPFEEIHLPPHLMPVNPEDEDDVVPDMHAAFGINRALGQGVGGEGVGGEGGAGGTGETSGRGAQREPVWRDLGLDRLMDGRENGVQAVRRGGESGSGTATGSVTGARREGRRTGLLLMR